MKKKAPKDFRAAICMLAAFAAWTAVVRFADVQAIGPNQFSAGLAALNRLVHSLTGVNLSLYVLTDWLGLVSVMIAAGFGVLGLVQWIRRKSIRRVDASLLVLGGFYTAVMVVYVFFENFIVNYRPVLIDGVLEESYPSSTTVLVLCVMPTAVMQLTSRIGNKALKRSVACAMIAFTAFMVIGRLFSGVHWFTDIIGGALLSAGLMLTYRIMIGGKNHEEKRLHHPTGKERRTQRG